uniref:RGS domain-containing protein n=1 Tax=Lutzomyia longipalpis TaxID=7200 RepID=A0A1B0CCP6_LUTLO
MAERWRSVVARLRLGLAIKNAEDNGPTKKDPAGSDLLCDGEQPTLEEIRSWGKSFDKLMRSPDSRVREIVNRNMVEPTPHTFDEAQLQIYTLMHRDSYPRFINSPLFKTLAQIPEGVSASGSQTESPT